MDKNKTGAVIWFTGLPGSGKTTLAVQLEKLLQQKGFRTYVLDGDELRKGLNSDLGFSMQDRSENIRRAAELARLFSQAGFLVLATFISPLQKDRDKAKAIVGNSFIEVFVNCPLEVCEKRDPKGLYKKARAGVIKDFTGIGSPYEVPVKAGITVRTDQQSVDKAVAFLEGELSKRL